MIAIVRTPSGVVRSKQKGDTMEYSEPFYLYDSSGLWIAFCLGLNLFDTDAVWRGWFQRVDLGNVYTPTGTYLATVVGNRLYWFGSMKHLRVHHYPDYPPIPKLPLKPRSAHRRQLPAGASNVKLKSIYGVLAD